MERKKMLKVGAKKPKLTKRLKRSRLSRKKKKKIRINGSTIKKKLQSNRKSYNRDK
jgi:hypothetical protein